MSEHSFDKGCAPKATVIRSSLASTFYLTMRLFLVAGAVLALCAVMFYSRWEAGRLSVNAVLYGTIIAVFMVFVIPSYFLRHVGRRIVLDADRLQIIDGVGEPVTQIPYRNIGRIETFGWLIHMLGISVSNKDRETFWGSGDQGKYRGYDVVIYDVYTEPVERIRELIRSADGLWRGAQASFPPVSYLASQGAPIAPPDVPPQSTSPQPASAGTGPASDGPRASSRAAEDDAGRPGKRAKAWPQARPSSQPAEYHVADPYFDSAPYVNGKGQGNVDLGPVLMEVESAAGTVHYTLLLYGYMLAGLMFIAAAVYLLLPVWSFWVQLTGIPCLAMGIGLGLACFNTLEKRLELRERGVRMRGVFRARELLYRDLTGVEIAPWIITRTLNFVPIARHSVLHLKFVPRDGTGLKPIEYYARFHDRDRITELIRTRWGKSDTDALEPTPRAAAPVESRSRTQAWDTSAVGPRPRAPLAPDGASPGSQSTTRIAYRIVIPVVVVAAVGLAIWGAVVVRSRMVDAQKQAAFAREQTALRDSNAQAEEARRKLQSKAIQYSLEAKQLQTESDEKATNAFLKAARVWAELAADVPGEPEFRAQRAAANAGLGEMYWLSGNTRDAENAYSDAVALWEPLAAEFPDRSNYRRTLAHSLVRLGETRWLTGRLVVATSDFHRALDVCQKLADGAPERHENQWALARSYSGLGIALAETGRVAEAKEHLVQGIALWKQLLPGFSSESEYHDALAAALLLSDQTKLRWARLMREKADSKSLIPVPNANDERKILSDVHTMADLLVAFGNHTAAATLARDVGRYSRQATAEECYAFARLYARCAALAGAEIQEAQMRDGTGSILAGYHDQARDWLAEAILAKGFKDVTRIEQDQAFQSVRSVPRIQWLFARLKPPQPPARSQPQWPRFRVGAFPARAAVESQPNRAKRQPDGEPVTPAASDPRIELRQRRDADVEKAQRLADKAYSKEALVIARRVLTAERSLFPESDPDIAAALTWFASIAKRFAQFEEARDALKEALQIRSKAHGADDWRTLDARYSLERAERLVGLDDKKRQKYRAAHEVLARSATLKHPQPHERDQILQLEREALALLKEALGENHPEYAFCLDSFVANTTFLWGSVRNELATSRTPNPLFDETLLMGTQAREIRRHALGERHPDYAVSLQNRLLNDIFPGGVSNSELKATLRQILEIRGATLGKHHPTYLSALDLLGFRFTVPVQSRAGIPEAEAIYREALDLARETYGPDDPRLRLPYGRLANIAQRWGQPDEAEKMEREIVRLLRQEFVALSRPGNDPWSDPSITLPDYNTNLHTPAVVRRTFSRINLLTRMGQRAQALAKKGDLAGATRCIEEATDFAVREVAFNAGWSQRSTAREIIDSDWRVLDTYLNRSFDPAAAISPFDAYRRAFAKKGARGVYERRARQLRKRPDLAPLFAELEAVSAETGRLGAARPEPGNTAAWRRLHALMNRKDELEAEVATWFIRLGLNEPVDTRVEDLPAVLPADSALVDFFVVEESRTFMLPQTADQLAQASAGGAAGRTRAVPANAFPRHVHAFVIRKEGQIVQFDLGPISESRMGGIAYSEENLAAVKSHLSGVRTLLVSPDSLFRGLELGRLPGEKPGNKIIDEMAIVMVPAPQLLVLQAPPPLPSSGLLMAGDIDFGSDPGAPAATKLGAGSPKGGGDPKRAKRPAFAPLPGTGLEIEAIGDRFRAAHPGSRSVILRGSEATERAFLAALPGSRFVHLATHGFFDQWGYYSLPPDGLPAYGQSIAPLAAQSPDLFAGLVFAGANCPPSPGSDDGIFTALEAKEHDLSGVELMVLSSCESAMGARTQREGMLGMQRALHVAGVRSLICTIGPVNDAAASVLMEEFYTNLWQRKLSPLEALRLAKFAVRDHPERVFKRWDELAAKRPRGLSEIPEKLSSGGRAPERSPAAWWAGFVLSVSDPAALASTAAVSGPAPAAPSQ
jgi:CHAT domain-containing protein/tetratricopeptide (TPR) repeat protein